MYMPVTVYSVLKHQEFVNSAAILLADRKETYLLMMGTNGHRKCFSMSVLGSD
jgi:hypothetical protein